MAKFRPAPSSRRQALPSTADLDVSQPMMLGRGQRESHPTERSMLFRQSVAQQNARLSAQRDRRVAVKTSVAPLQVHHLDAALTVSTDAVGADFAEEEEMENDPDANEDGDAGDDDDVGDPATISNTQGLTGVSERNVSIASSQIANPVTAHSLKKNLVRRAAVSRIALPEQAVRPGNTQPTGAAASMAPSGTQVSDPRDVASRGADVGRSTGAGSTKRSLPIVVSDDEDTEVVAKKSKPKAGDYAGSRRAHLLRACALFRVAISTTGAFPDGVALDQLAYDCFISTDEDNDPRSEPTDHELKVIKLRGSQLRGQVVTNTKALIKTSFGFSSADDDDITIEANRIKYDGFTERAAFTYEVPGVRTPGTLFRNPIFLEIAQKTWFRNRRDEGVMFHEEFDSGPGFPLPALALIITTVKNGLDEWKTGVHTPIDFSEKGYADEYSAILNTLREWRNVTGNSGSHTAAKFQIDFLRRCRSAVGILNDNAAKPTNTQLTRADILADDAAPQAGPANA